MTAPALLPLATTPDGVSVGTMILLVIAAFAAGWIDAVVGGGGLIQLPALLLVPGITPLQALATNKLGSIAGTATSSLTYYRRVRPDLRTALPIAGIALVGAMGGALLASRLSASVFKPIIVLILIAVAIFTWLRPELGTETRLRHTGARHLMLGVLLGAVIGFYDGIMGPGTGSFLAIALVSVLGYSFLEATAKAKITNFATNVGAMAIFVPQGAVLWGVGLFVAAANMTGAYVGARSAVRGGNRFIRIAFFIVVAVLIAKLGIDVWQENLAPAAG